MGLAQLPMMEQALSAIDGAPALASVPSSDSHLWDGICHTAALAPLRARMACCLVLTCCFPGTPCGAAPYYGLEGDEVPDGYSNPFMEHFVAKLQQAFATTASAARTQTLEDDEVISFSLPPVPAVAIQISELLLTRTVFRFGSSGQMFYTQSHQSLVLSLPGGGALSAADVRAAAAAADERRRGANPSGVQLPAGQGFDRLLDTSMAHCCYPCFSCSLLRSGWSAHSADAP